MSGIPQPDLSGNVGRRQVGRVREESLRDRPEQVFHVRGARRLVHKVEAIQECFERSIVRRHEHPDQRLVVDRMIAGQKDATFLEVVGERMEKVAKVPLPDLT
jgi:hypothetical protein